MTRIIAGSLTVQTVTPTGNTGEYLIESAMFNNQADAQGIGAFAILAGFVLCLPVVDPNIMTLVPGGFSRYKALEATVIDATFVTLRIKFDGGTRSEYDYPAEYSTGIISEPSAWRSFGYPISPSVYPELPAGIDIAALALDNFSLTDNIRQTGTGGGSSSTYLHVQDSPQDVWTISHNLGSMTFSYQLFSATGSQFIPDEVWAVDQNTISVSMLQASSGRAAFSFF